MAAEPTPTPFCGRRCGMALRFPILLGLLLLSSLVTSCDRDPREGARIAEAPDGRWLSVCGVRVRGPANDAQRVQGEAVHSSRREARRRAIAEACATVEGSPSCEGQGAGWRITEERCAESRAPPIEKKAPAVLGTTHPPKPARSFRCLMKLSRPAGKPERTGGGEGKSAAKACIEARRQACEALKAGPDCVHSRGGWSAASTVGRRRR